MTTLMNMNCIKYLNTIMKRHCLCFGAFYNPNRLIIKMINLWWSLLGRVWSLLLIVIIGLLLWVLWACYFAQRVHKNSGRDQVETGKSSCFNRRVILSSLRSPSRGTRGHLSHWSNGLLPNGLKQWICQRKSNLEADLSKRKFCFEVLSGHSMHFMVCNET